MAAYRRVYDLRRLQADCQEPGSAPEAYARQSSMGYLYLYLLALARMITRSVWRRFSMEGSWFKRSFKRVQN